MPKSTPLPKSNKEPPGCAPRKKTVQELLLEGLVKTGKTLIDEGVQKSTALEIFAQAAQEEERMRSQKVSRLPKSGKLR